MQTTELAGLVAVVTGATGGIGSETALALAEAGAAVVLADLPGTPLSDLADQLVGKGHRAAAHPVDIADETSVRALMAFIKDRFGRLDVVDNNAAATTFTGQDVDVSTMAVEVWDTVMAVNARGTMLMCKHALPILEAGGGGSIVNISSGASLAGDMSNIAYAASKAAVNALTRSIATGWGGRGVRCNAIAPGLVATPALEAAMPPPFQETFLASSLVPRFGQPRDIADMVVFLASDRSSWITGQVFPVDGGFTAHLPHVAGVKALLAQLTAPDPEP